MNDFTALVHGIFAVFFSTTADIDHMLPQNFESRVDASNLLQDRRPLSKVMAPVDDMPSFSEIKGPLPVYGELNSKNKTLRYTDNGEDFMMSRLESETFPIPAPLCTPFIVGSNSRLDGRDQQILHNN